MTIFSVCTLKKGAGMRCLWENKLMIAFLWEKKINFVVFHLSTNYFIRYQLMLEMILSQTFLNNNCANQHYLEEWAHFLKVFLKYPSIQLSHCYNTRGSLGSYNKTFLPSPFYTQMYFVFRSQHWISSSDRSKNWNYMLKSTWLEINHLYSNKREHTCSMC